jgi:hypothetical protein
MKLGDQVPAWVRERRQPTRAELAAKHAADGGGMNTSSSLGTDVFDEPLGGEGELVPVGDTGCFVRKPKEASAGKVKVRRFNV